MVDVPLNAHRIDILKYARMAKDWCFGLYPPLQDEVIVSDAERLSVTQSNVKMLQRHFQADTLPWIQRLKQKEQILQQRDANSRGVGGKRLPYSLNKRGS
ncbi:nuclear pore complex protein Nup54-like [Trifolium medium]|uniref:Nuclear pore complex protein Nup54-like n=1 Tax=Trifolium medium TaxID=97028 RepID=A0A392MK55_9FABA|nr:nuclear pore complex protein Nup54-like [Trifolium medium]